jgi:hypothetical protein
MFVSKLLNQLFFNTNNDNNCVFTTLSNTNRFMLTKDNMNVIINDLECSSNDTSMEIVPPSPISDQVGIAKQERCITPIPFETEPNTPEKLFRPIQIPPDTAASQPTNPTFSSATLEGLQGSGLRPGTGENEAHHQVLSQYSGGIAPKQQDTLFWCIYIIAYGYGEYINIDRNYGVAELENKKKIADYLQVNGSKMKQTNYKITKAAVQEIMSEFLTNQKDTSFQCLLALCVYHNINIVILHNNNKLMLEFMYEVDYGIDNKENPFYVLKKDGYGKYSVDTEKKTWKEVQEMKNQYVCLDNHMKPMKAASHYKLEDLDTLADKLGVLDVTKKYKKAELYHLVNESMNWYK